MKQDDWYSIKSWNFNNSNNLKWAFVWSRAFLPAIWRIPFKRKKREKEEKGLKEGEKRGKEDKEENEGKRGEKRGKAGKRREKGGN